MTTYRIEKPNMQKLVEALRPVMVADPKFRAECEASMQVRADHVSIHFDDRSSADPRLQRAAVEFGIIQQ